MTPALQKKPRSKPLVRTDHTSLSGLLSELCLTRTQTEAAALMGISQPTFCHWSETPPRYTPSLRLARRVSANLGISVDYFLRIVFRDEESKPV